MNCPICSHLSTDVLYTIKDMPVFSNLLWDNQKEAVESPKGDIKLVFCDNCGMIFNQDFDPIKVSYHKMPYENPLHYSPVFRQYANDLVH